MEELPRKLLAETLPATFLTVCVDSAGQQRQDHTRLGHFLSSVSTRSDIWEGFKEEVDG